MWPNFEWYELEHIWYIFFSSSDNYFPSVKWSALKEREKKTKSIIYNLQYNIEVRLIWIEAHFSKVESFIINHSPQIFEQTIIIYIFQEKIHKKEEVRHWICSGFHGLERMNEKRINEFKKMTWTKQTRRKPIDFKIISFVALHWLPLLYFIRWTRNYFWICHI